MSDAAAGVTLAIDASTYVGTVAVVRGDRVLAEGEAAMRGRDEERLMPAVVAALAAAGVAAADVDRVACGAGPGSFTSLRIAGAIAKGLALALDRPLFALSTAALVVAGGVDAPAPGRYLVLVDAMRGDVYATPVDVDADGRLTEGATSIVPASAAAALSPGATLVGPAAPADGGSMATALPHARALARPAAQALLGAPVALDGWEPSYGRLAEAQVKWEAAHGRPLAAG